MTIVCSSPTERVGGALRAAVVRAATRAQGPRATAALPAAAAAATAHGTRLPALLGFRQHDAPSGHSCYGKCAPCGEVGNYIMFPSAAPAKKPNNDKFSPCSLESIRSVLVPMIAGDSPRENCFLGKHHLHTQGVFHGFAGQDQSGPEIPISSQA
ncbi:hypothetical protein V5799_016301 [Amblyomma americanum]|uniref:Uncharacterized protein n=1 Tax=Amblyomma americanum TaxID=6943 RepID=A0AAQ4F5I9_AMBAM